jgi:EAL domain-containing protein (putative c-di-GMP-specific phosphodiesterase class I)
MQLEGVIHRAVKARRTSRLLKIADEREQQQQNARERFARALGGLWMAFQPIVSWSSRAVVGYEALMRSTEATLSTPAELLQAAGDLNQIGLLGQHVRRKVASILAGCTPAPTMFVNLHPLELLDESLYDRLAPLSAFAHQVSFEVRERAALEDVPDFLAKVRRLRSLGYRVVVSDVAQGFSGLGSLALLEPDAVKLEMSLFRQIESASTRRKLLRALVGLCRDLQVPLIAERVETEPERDAFLAEGGDLLQGYLFARPEFPFPVPRF